MSSSRRYRKNQDAAARLWLAFLLAGLPEMKGGPTRCRRGGTCAVALFEAATQADERVRLCLRF